MRKELFVINCGQYLQSAINLLQAIEEQGADLVSMAMMKDKANSIGDSYVVCYRSVGPVAFEMLT